MSCFIHDDRSFDVVFATIKHLSHKGELPGYIKPREFVACLREYNYKAFDERYKENTEIEPWTPKTELPLSAVACFKLLSSLDYQCVDSHEYCDSETRKELDQVQLALASSHFNSLAEYRTAPWSYNDCDRTEMYALSELINK